MATLPYQNHTPPLFEDAFMSSPHHAPLIQHFTVGSTITYFHRCVCAHLEAQAILLLPEAEVCDLFVPEFIWFHHTNQRHLGWNNVLRHTRLHLYTCLVHLYLSK